MIPLYQTALHFQEPLKRISWNHNQFSKYHIWHTPGFPLFAWVPVFDCASLSFLLSDLQDFRDAVSKVSGQSGKPVIEERLLNQILYYLPQLYELNQDLLRELKQRVAKWYNKMFLHLYWSLLLAPKAIIHIYYLAKYM